MNLVRIYPYKPWFRFICKRCNISYCTADAEYNDAGHYADLDGKPFEDYYCKDCVEGRETDKSDAMIKKGQGNGNL